MRIVILGASSPFSLSFLKKNSSKISHLLLQTKNISELNKHIPLLGLKCPVEIIEGDFLKPEENYLQIFHSYLKRLGSIDAIVFSCGQWQAHQEIKHICPSEHIKSWQVNYLFPVSLCREMIPFLSKGFKLWHNLLEERLMSPALNSLNIPPSDAMQSFLQAYCLENHGCYLKSSTQRLYQSVQSAKVFSDLEKIDERELPIIA